jgi:hypothetical protein
MALQRTRRPRLHDSKGGTLSTRGETFLRIFRARQVFAEGFEIDSNGRIRDLAENELYGFI